MSAQLGTFAFSALVSLLVLYALYQILIRGFVHTFRSWGPEKHLRKRAVPTGGGIIFLIVLVAMQAVGMLMSDALFSPEDRYLKASLMLTGLAVLLGLLGFADDWLKVRRKSSTGLLARYKLLAQLLLCLLFLWQVYPYAEQEALIPFSEGGVSLPLWVFMLIGAVLLMGMVNGMNFADGLDGLASGLSLIMLGTLVFTFNLTGWSTPDNPLGNMLLFGSITIAGAAFAFLVANFRPALLYMGDTGSYALGAFIGGVAILSGFMFYLVIIGVLLAVEILSVVLQVVYFRLTAGGRIFKMSPLHHHFELSGMSELAVVFVFWGAQAILGVIAVSGYFWSTL